jgi:hypothetical protein
MVRGEGVHLALPGDFPFFSEGKPKIVSDYLEWLLGRHVRDILFCAG